MITPLDIRSPTPLNGGNFPFSKMGIPPPDYDRIIDISIFTFDKLKYKIIQEIRKYFKN